MSWFFAPFYDRFMAQTEEACLRDWRQDLLQHATGRVLEIGAGTGVTCSLYPPTVTHVTFCEPDQGMRQQLEQNLAQATVPWPYDLLDAPAERLPFPDDTFDTAVAMLVLCTVHDPRQAISELERVLRPDGTLLFLEHVAAEHGSKRRFWQGAVEPVWKRLAGGCHLTRETETLLSERFTVQAKPESMRKALALVRPTIRGRAYPIGPSKL